MSRALSNDPLTIRLLALGNVPLSLTRSGSGYGSASQQAHVATWNAPDGIRAEAVRAGVLTWTESNVLKHALDLWPWLPEADRRNANRVVSMLFYARRHFGFDNFDRTYLVTVDHFRIRPEKPALPSSQWRKSRLYRLRDRERGSFVTL